MEYTKIEIEKTNRQTLLAELRNISSLAFPGDVAKQNAEKIVMRLRLQDGKITKDAYEMFWKSLQK